MGCGNDDLTESSVTATSGTHDKWNATQARREIRGVFADLADRSLACEQLSDRYLSENYDARGSTGRRQCEKAASGRAPGKVMSVEFLGLHPRSAIAAVSASGGEKAKASLVYVHGRWLIDDLESGGK